MMTLMMAHQGSNSKIGVLIDECHKLNINVLPPDINLSLKHFSLKNREILMGFNSIKGIGEETSKKIINARENTKNKKFNDYVDCVKELSKSSIGESTIQTLIYAGMFDCFNLDREYMILNLPSLLLDCKQIKKDGEFLFPPILKDVQDFTDRIDLNTINDKCIELLGYDFSSSIENYNKQKSKISFTNEQLEKINKYKLTDVLEIGESQNFVNCLVTLKSIRKTLTKNGKKMAFLSFRNSNNSKIHVACFNSFYIDDYFKIDN